eukprot:scaffold8574_cov70-Cylindrotheca_fusiformis.AAC.1
MMSSQPHTYPLHPNQTCLVKHAIDAFRILLFAVLRTRTIAAWRKEGDHRTISGVPNQRAY